MDTKASRDNSFDIARALAFFAVIWGHLFPLHGMWFVYGFHLQVFYIAAGYFLHTDAGFGSFVVKKAKRLVVPYILVGIAISLAMMIQEYLKGKAGFDVQGYLKEQLYYYYWEGTSPIGPMWFLPALFYALVIVYLLAKKKYGVGLLPFIVVAGYLVSTKLWLPFFILHGLVASGYVGIGYCIAQCRELIEKRLSGKKEAFFAAAFFVSMVIWVIFQKTMTGMVYLYANDLPRGAIDYFGSLAAVYAIWYISKKVLARIPLVERYLSFVGKNTMRLLYIHEFDIFLNVVNRYVGELPLEGMRLNAVQLLTKIAVYSVIAWIISIVLREKRTKLPA